MLDICAKNYKNRNIFICSIWILIYFLILQVIDKNIVNKINSFKNYLEFNVGDSGNQRNYNREYISINTKVWGLDSFSGMNQTLIKIIGIDQYMCPSDRNFTIAASYYASRYDYIQIKIYRWANKTSSSVVCKSTTEIENAVKVSTLRVPITNTYFNFKDYD